MKAGVSSGPVLALCSYDGISISYSSHLLSSLKLSQLWVLQSFSPCPVFCLLSTHSPSISQQLVTSFFSPLLCLLSCELCLPGLWFSSLKAQSTYQLPVILTYGSVSETLVSPCSWRGSAAISHHTCFFFPDL